MYPLRNEGSAVASTTVHYVSRFTNCFTYTCIPDRYVTQSEFDKKQISNSLWWIQPCSPRDKTASRDRREPRLSFDGRRYSTAPFYMCDSFLRDYRVYFKEIRIKMSNRIFLFPWYYANGGFYPLFLFFFFFLLCFVGILIILCENGDPDRLFLKNKTGMRYPEDF